MTYKLYIDESGVADLKHHSKNYTLCGIIVKPHEADQLKIKADQIKFKYWNRTDIVFHSAEIGKRKGDFTILNSQNIEKEFHRDLFTFLEQGHFKIIIISIDKNKAIKTGWGTEKIQAAAFDTIIKTFLSFLTTIKNQKGQIIMESNGGKDIEFYRRYIYYLSHGCNTLTSQKIRKMLTAISFVSKNNHDIETQLADIFAWPATQQCLQKEGDQMSVANSYEYEICNILKNKIITVDQNKTFYKLP